jgi:hypothetical protein
MDLFAPVVDESKFDPTFAKVLSQRNPHNEAVLQRWADGFVDRDEKFVREFQTTFHACYWELYLHAWLKDLGCRIDFSHSAPDFVVTDPVPFVVEATVALQGEHGTSIAESTLQNLPPSLNEFNRQAIIRLANSVSTKKRKYDTSYSKLPHVLGKPFVLALAPFDRPFAWMQAHRAIEALLFQYYVDEDEHLRAGDMSAPLVGRRMEEATKNSGASVPLGIFNDDSHREISAVLFNSCMSWGKVRALSNDPNPMVVFQAGYHNPNGTMPEVVTSLKADYHETLQDGMKIYHNPHALHPLPPVTFRRPGVFQAYFDHARGEWEVETNGRLLLFRQVLTARERN